MEGSFFLSLPPPGFSHIRESDKKDPPLFCSFPRPTPPKKNPGLLEVAHWHISGGGKNRIDIGLFHFLQYFWGVFFSPLLAHLGNRLFWFLPFFSCGFNTDRMGFWVSFFGGRGRGKGCWRCFPTQLLKKIVSRFGLKHFNFLLFLGKRHLPTKKRLRRGVRGNVSDVKITEQICWKTEGAEAKYFKFLS